jgi:hypothetical protein
MSKYVHIDRYVWNEYCITDDVLGHAFYLITCEITFPEE